MKDFEQYSQQNLQFYWKSVPHFFETIINHFDLNEEPYLIDIGCGDGVLLFSLIFNNYLPSDKVVGIDLSRNRLIKLKKILPLCDLICGDACNLFFLKPKKFNIAISTQVIKHVPDQISFLKGVYSLLKPQSYFYISSVLKKKNAFWIYRNNGRIVLDPTHIHEFESQDEFISLLKKNGFSPIYIQTYPVKYGLMEYLIRFLNIIGLQIRNTEFFFINHDWTSHVNKIKIPVPGYLIIEGLFRRC